MERPIRYVRESFFYGRKFFNDADLNEQAARWLDVTANARRHGTTSVESRAPVATLPAPGSQRRQEHTTEIAFKLPRDLPGSAQL